MSAKKLLDYEIRQTTTGDGVTKVTGDLAKFTDGLSNNEKAILGARTTIGGLDKDITLFGRNVGSAADAMSAFGISIPQSPMALFGQVVRGVTDTLWESIQMAGDAQEQQSLFQQTFRDESEETRAELEAFGDDVGRSTYALMDMASGIQTILAPMGMGRDAAADWSVKLTQLATDLGAAFNREDADVLADIRSGLMGSTEVMEKYGVNLKMSAINQELLNMGLEGGIAKASEEEKMMARLNLVMAQTSDYQGQAARESDSFNGQMKEFQATMTDLKIMLGEEFLPVAIEVLSWITNSSRTIDTSRRFWAALNEAVELGVITQEDYDRKAKKFQRTAREGNAITEESIEEIEALEEATKRAAYEQGEWGHVIELASLDQGYFADQTARAGKAVIQYRGDLEEASIVTQDFIDAVEEITSLDSNFQGMINYAIRYNSVMDEINEKEARMAELMAIMETGGYIDGAYVSASKAKEEFALLTGEVEALQTSMSELAKQVVLDMYMATISIDEVTQTEADAYFQLAADMKLISQEAADEAMLVYGNAIAYINGLQLQDKHATYSWDFVGPNTPPIGGGGGGGGGGEEGGGGGDNWKYEPYAEGGIVYPSQQLLVGELGPEPFVPQVPGQVVSNRDYQNAGKAVGGVTIIMQGPVYMRTEEEIRDVLEKILVEASRG